jgi:Fe-S-cluster containining protein
MEAANLSNTVTDTAWRPDVRKAVADLHDEVAAEVAKRRPLCVLSGKCCRFEEYGHRLYVTTLELAAFLSAYMDSPLADLQRPAWDGAGCPFQEGRVCSVHSIRPFGCRMFFCDATSTAWQQDLYEGFHSQIKRLHETLQVPYAYVEWRAALAKLGFTKTKS